MNFSHELMIYNNIMSTLTLIIIHPLSIKYYSLVVLYYLINSERPAMIPLHIIMTDVNIL